MLKALIIDDEEALCDIIVEVFDALDITSITASSGEEAIMIANDNDPFDLIVVDMNMPGMNGEETYEKLKEKNANSALIVMSGYDLSIELENMNLSCPNTFLKKPFSIIELSKIASQLVI